MLALRNRKEKHAFDSRILGDSGFEDEIKSKLNDLVKKNLRVSGQRIDLEKLSKLRVPSSVIPAEAGIQKLLILLDSRVRGNDNDAE